jgi:3-hydroxyanthranilate 3,4-dioxygenase
MSTYSLNPESLPGWIEQNKSRLAPPVCNALIANNQLKTMIVGGPNVRRDFHVNPTEEWFYQLQGPMVLTIVDSCGTLKNIPILEGEHFLLPPNIPHSPQRFANTIGLVMETQRPDGDLDRLTYYCPKCHEINFTDAFECTDLGIQLVPFIKQYYANDELRKCKGCGFEDFRPTVPVEISTDISITENGSVGTIAALPIDIEKWFQDGKHAGVNVDKGNLTYLGNSLQIHRYSAKTPSDQLTRTKDAGERWIYTIDGVCKINLYDGDEIKEMVLSKNDFILLPPNQEYQIVIDNDDDTKVVSCLFVPPPQ